MGGGALAKHTPEAYPEAYPRSIPRSKPPKMKIIFEGLLMVVIWRSWAQIYQDGSQHLLHAAFRRPLRHPALHPRISPQSGCPMQPSRLKGASVLTGRCSFIVAADTVCINQLLVLTGRCSSCLNLIRCAE